MKAIPKQTIKVSKIQKMYEYWCSKQLGVVQYRTQNAEYKIAW